MNLDGKKPDHVPQDQWDRMKEVFNEIYEDDNMERLTNEQFSCMQDFCSHTECELYADCPAIAKHNRLCAYEDTGLTPEQVAAQRWIPVTERLPEENERVLACYINPLRKGRPPRMMVGEGTSTQIVKGKVYLWCGGWRSITHWMPLPMPPEEG